MDIEKIKTHMCANYCKHFAEIRATFEDIDRGQEELDRICEHCPLNELEDVGFGSAVKISKNDKVIIESTVWLKNDVFSEIAETIKKQFNESQLVFLPHGITAKVISSDVIPCEDCKWWDDKYEAERCTHDFGCRWAKPNNFCGYAERRTE